MNLRKDLAADAKIIAAEAIGHPQKSEIDYH